MMDDLLNQAMNYLAVGGYQEAIQILQKILAKDPEISEAHLGLAQAYTRLGLYEQALGHYQEYLTRKPDDAEAYYSLSGVFWAMGWVGFKMLLMHAYRLLRFNPLQRLFMH